MPFFATAKAYLPQLQPQAPPLLSELSNIARLITPHAPTTYCITGKSCGLFTRYSASSKLYPSGLRPTTSDANAVTTQVTIPNNFMYILSLWPSSNNIDDPVIKILPLSYLPYPYLNCNNVDLINAPFCSTLR